jgi:predicted TPR repeat methyltransferase
VTRLGYRGPWNLFELLCEVIAEESGGEGEGGGGGGCDKGLKCDNSESSDSNNENDVLNHASTDIAHNSNESKQHSTTHDTKRNPHTSQSESGVTSKSKKNHSKIQNSKYPKKGSWRILDLGCGSGLCGKVFQEFVKSPDLKNCEGKAGKGDGQGDGEGKSSATETGTVRVGVEEESGCVGSLKAVDLGSECGVDDTSEQLEMLRAIRMRCGGGERGGGGGRGIMVGADVSIKMVEISRKTGCYSCVARADLSDAIKIFECTDDERTDIRNDSPVHLNEGGLCYNPESKRSEEHSTKYSLLLDLVIVADTFIYVGTLGSVFAQIKRSLKKNGLLIFSIEDLDVSPMRTEVTVVVQENTNTQATSTGVAAGVGVQDCVSSQNKETSKMKNISNLETRILDDGKEVTIVESEIQGAVPGWGAQLLKSARFAHSNSYIEALCQIHGFQILKMKIVVLRTEETVPLHGRLYVLQTV